LKIGARVIAPLGKRKLIGYVLEIKELEEAPEFEVKKILQILDDHPVFSESFLGFVLELARRNLTAPGLFLEMAKSPEAKEKFEVKIGLTEKGKEELKNEILKGKKREVLKLLAGRKLSPVYLRRKSGIKGLDRVLKLLTKEGLIEVQEQLLIRKGPRAESRPLSRQLRLPVKPEGFSEIEYQFIENLENNQSGQFLLTGDFDQRLKFLLRLTEYCQENYGYILILVPDIQRLKRWQPFIDSIRSRAVIWHSQLSGRARAEAWQKLRSGRVRVVFGTRSALFLPIQPFSLIIVDEEQDELHYQSESPAFDAREGAEIRASFEAGLVIFSSAYPRISQYYRHQQAGSLIELTRKAANYRLRACQGEIGQALKKELKLEIENHLEKSGRVFFFVNRKGYASYLICQDCGYVPSCPKCQISLTLKKSEGELICHYCGETIPAPEKCPICGQKLRIGRVKGNEYLKEKIAEVFPGIPVEVLEESDETVIQKKLRKFKAGRVNIVIGTEFALSRLPINSFSLVVLVNPENSLNFSNFRAAEICFTTISRIIELLKNEDSSQAISLTSGPEPLVVRYALLGDYNGFFKKEIEYRNLLNYPPFSFLAEISVGGS
ncbi:MAG: replication restart helicase PriA, partial [Candidatus Saccharicenans sp.]